MQPLDTLSIASFGGAYSLPLKIYTGVLGQLGDVIGFSATARRIKEIFPNSAITFAVSKRFQEAGELLVGLPYIDKLFVTELYFEKLTPELVPLFEAGWNVELRGEDEIEEQKGYDLVLETRPRCRRANWWQYAHQVGELAHRVGIPSLTDLRTEIAIPPGTEVPRDVRDKIILHNDAITDTRKGWSWDYVRELVQRLPEGSVTLIGTQGERVDGVMDLRGQTTLAQAASIISQCRCYIGIDSGPMWIAGSLQAPTIGLYGTDYIAAYSAITPYNPNALYLQAEGNVSEITPETVLTALWTLEARRTQRREEQGEGDGK